jgi:hypothetical protein
MSNCTFYYYFLVNNLTFVVKLVLYFATRSDGAAGHPVSGPSKNLIIILSSVLYYLTSCIALLITIFLVNNLIFVVKLVLYFATRSDGAACHPVSGPGQHFQLCHRQCTQGQGRKAYDCRALLAKLTEKICEMAVMMMEQKVQLFAINKF